MERVTNIQDIRLFVDTIGEAGLEKDIRVPPKDMEGVLRDDDLHVEEPFSVHYEVERAQQTIHVKVDIRGDIHTTCARCLSPMVHVVNLHLESDFVPAPSFMTGDLEAQRTSADTGYYRKDIHLGGYICSELVLSLPYIYVCSETCRGMCPRCGANLNSGVCACERDADERPLVSGRLTTTR